MDNIAYYQGGDASAKANLMPDWFWVICRDQLIRNAQLQNRLSELKLSARSIIDFSRLVFYFNETQVFPLLSLVQLQGVDLPEVREGWAGAGRLLKSRP